MYGAPDKNRQRQVAFYGRVSTEHEAQISALENQIDWYQQLLNTHPNWVFVKQYADEGITGTSAEKRPAFMQMIRDAHAGKFDLIVTREVSRFARNTVDTINYTRKLRRIGVEIYFVTDGIWSFDTDGELRLTIMASMAQEESRKTSVRVKSGQEISMQNGVFYGNGNILGYDRVGKDLIINPEQAETVRMIFDWYLDGMGLMKICDELERRGRKTAMGYDRWYPTVVSHVLKNSFYCGIITYHKEFVRDYLEQKKIKNYGEIELIQVRGTHEPIVTAEEYERVQKIMESKRGNCSNLNVGRLPKGKRKAESVWSRIVKCSCGNSFSRIKWSGSGKDKKFGYQCSATVHSGSYESRLKKGLPTDGICRTPAIPEWKFQMMAKYIFKNLLAEREQVMALANSIIESHLAESERKKPENTRLLVAKQCELKKLNEKYDAYVEMRADGEITRELFREKSEDLIKSMEQMKEEIRALTPVDVVEAVLDYENKITFLRYTLEQMTAVDTEQPIPDSVIEAFIEKVVVFPDRFEWHLRFCSGPDPFKCKIEGKRESDSRISTDFSVFPPVHNSSTGRDQGLISARRTLSRK